MFIIEWTFNPGMDPGDYCIEEINLNDNWSNFASYHEFEQHHCIEVNYF